MKIITAGIALIVIIASILMCLFFAYQGGKRSRDPKYDRITIMVGIGIGGAIGLGLIIGTLFF
jgi:VIT1/CCC1 family predicted Fe2+/Mn2+ transporter